MKTANSLLKDNSERAKSLILVLWLFVGLFFIGLLFSFNELSILYQLQTNNEVADSRLNFSDISLVIVGAFQLLFHIATIVVFLNWFRRAYANLYRLRIPIESNDSMAVWSFFIPIYNLFKPYQIMKEIWEKTQQAVKKIDVSFLFNKNSYLIGLWWFLFIISGVVDRVAFKMALKQETVNQLIEGTKISIISDVISIINAIVLIYLVKNISQFESVLFEKTKLIPVENIPSEKTPEKKKVKFRGEE